MPGHFRSLIEYVTSAFKDILICILCHLLISLLQQFQPIYNDSVISISILQLVRTSYVNVKQQLAQDGTLCDDAAGFLGVYCLPYS